MSNRDNSKRAQSCRRMSASQLRACIQGGTLMAASAKHELVVVRKEKI